ncbi:MAG: acireductone synthase [Woeseiaceae bacterium]|nr:acireductone synthase [Woeseiaceae bacterium]
MSDTTAISGPLRVAAIVLDIEGTTSSIDFVHEVLFPYAARELPAFVRNNHQQSAVRSLLADVRSEAREPEAATERIVQILLQWIKEDRKATSLKALQGMVWEKGYRDGDFKGHVYPEASRNMRDWAAGGIGLYIYSSGSVQAQKLLFGHSEAGDLRPLIRGYFDTRIGPKRDMASYRLIADTLQLSAGKILFLSDVAAELDAAASAGMQTVQLVRDARVVRGRHRMAADFDSIPVSLIAQ